VSLFGRVFRKNRTKVPSNKEPLLLDIGAGANYKDGWVHVDFFRYSFKFWKSKNFRKKPEVEMDLRYPINCPNNTVDGVYSCHVLEHLNYNEANRLIKEIYRILKPNCYLRIIVPDLETYIEFYTKKSINPKFQFGCEAISYLTQMNGHKSVWDTEYLMHVLKLNGFIDVKRVRYGKEGVDARLIKDNMNRESESIVLEAKKPND